MPATTHDLTELEHDALTELVNLGVGRAAVALREMAGEEVLLSVPAVSTVTAEQAAEMIGGPRVGKLVAVEERFSGEISGRALLIFPEASSFELVRAVTGEELPPEQIVELAPDALCETGNVLLQACLGVFANLLQRNLSIAVPQLVRGRAWELIPRRADDVVMFVYINFRLGGRRIRGYIALLMDVPSMTALKLLLDAFIQRETP